MPVVDSSNSNLIAVGACFLLTLFIWLSRRNPDHPYPPPPGPKPIPLIGNIRDLTAKELWLPASKWAKTYGDVVYLHVFGIGLVFLNSPEAASELLDKRGSIYSDKPSLVMAGELCGCKNMAAFTGYGPQFKRQRRLLHKAFGLPVIPTYHPLLLSSTHTFLRALVSSPSSYLAHIRRYAGGLTLSVVYGYEPTRDDDEFLLLAEECVGLLANRIASGGGVWLVDVLPWLKYLPDWAPGAGFKRNARVWKRKMEEFVDRPYEFMKSSLKSGTYKPSFCSNLLEDPSLQPSSNANSSSTSTEKDKEKDKEEKDNFEFDLKWSANSMYSASIDTTITVISHFLLAMMNNPHVQRKAQAEIDQITNGGERLPGFEDRERLVYVECIFKEVLRWGVPVPLNLPHRLMEDDVYNGMFLKKGSLVFGNIWAMLRNEAMYPNPEKFDPERFMQPASSPEEERRRNPKGYVFGFGRRQCPGMNLVDSSVWLLMASMLATLDISKAVDERGMEVDVKEVYENPIFRTPNPFPCGIKPRNAKALSLIKQSSEVFGA